MSLKYTYLSQKELIARLVGYSSRATALFTGTLKVKLQGIVNATYELGLLNGAIVFCKGQKNHIPLYGNTALRSLVEDLSSPNVMGDINFIEAKPYEIEAQVTANPLIAIQTPVYFEDLSTLVLSDIETTSPTTIMSKKKPIIHKSISDQEVGKTRSEKRRRGFKKDLSISRINSEELYKGYVELLKKHYRELLSLSKYIGLLTANSSEDLSELLLKYSSNRGLLLANIKPEHGLIECIAAIYRRKILGVYCYSSGLELKNTDYTQPFNECSPSCTVELHELDNFKLNSSLKERLLHVIDDLESNIYRGVIKNGADMILRYYIVLSNKRITRLGGTITKGNKIYHITKNIVRNVLVNILLSHINDVKPLGTRDLRKVKAQWITVSERDWRYALNIAHRFVELYPTI